MGAKKQKKGNKKKKKRDNKKKKRGSRKHQQKGGGAVTRAFPILKKVNNLLHKTVVVANKLKKLKKS